MKFIEPPELSLNTPVFAPLDGFTDLPFRNVIKKLYPEWGYLFTGFLRLPVSAPFKDNHILKFLGPNDKTVLHLMATPKTLNIETAIQLNNLQIPWVDLNFGCPSNRVNSRFGGAALLAHPEYITKIIRDFREHYQGFLSIKIRAGFQDSDNFQKVLQICKQENVDCLTVHGRLQTQQYLGKSNWNYIVEAKKALSIPIIGNGDVWTVSDYQNMTNETKCNAVMIGRGALKTPWFPKLLKQIEIDEFTENKKLFRELLEAYLSTGIKESSIVQRFKGFAFFMFEKNLKDQTQLMQSQTSAAFFSEIDRLFELKNKREIPE